MPHWKNLPSYDSFEYRRKISERHNSIWIYSAVVPTLIPPRTTREIGQKHCFELGGETSWKMVRSPKCGACGVYKMKKMKKKNINNIYKVKVLVKINLLKCDEDIYKNHSHVNGEIFSHVKTLKQWGFSYVSLLQRNCANTLMIPRWSIFLVYTWV